MTARPEGLSLEEATRRMQRIHELGDCQGRRADLLNPERRRARQPRG